MGKLTTFAKRFFHLFNLQLVQMLVSFFHSICLFLEECLHIVRIEGSLINVNFVILPGRILGLRKHGICG